MIATSPTSWRAEQIAFGADEEFYHCDGCRRRSGRPSCAQPNAFGLISATPSSPSTARGRVAQGLAASPPRSTSPRTICSRAASRRPALIRINGRPRVAARLDPFTDRSISTLQNSTQVPEYGKPRLIRKSMFRENLVSAQVVMLGQYCAIHMSILFCLFIYPVVFGILSNIPHSTK
jgi:hypothetical protein